MLGARRRGVSPLAPRRELDLDDAGATVNNSLGTHAATRTISEPDANGETRVTASTVGALERMVRLAEAGAYLGAAVQPTRRLSPEKGATFTNRTLLHIACKTFFIEASDQRL